MNDESFNEEVKEAMKKLDPKEKDFDKYYHYKNHKGEKLE